MDNTNESQPARPMFLIVLCFMTFISSFSGLWKYAEQMWSPGRAAAQTQELMERMLVQFEAQTENQPGGKEAQQMMAGIVSGLTPDRIQRSAIVMLIYESLTLFGAFYMYLLQRKGFYMYLGGIAAGIIGTLVYTGGLSGIALTLGSLLISAVMAVLYRLNVKHLY